MDKSDAKKTKTSKQEIINNEQRIFKRLWADLVRTQDHAEYGKQFRLQIGRKMTM